MASGIISSGNVISTESDEEPSLQIKTRPSVFNVGEKKAIYCKGHNVPERIDWVSPSNHVVDGRSNKNTRIYVERKDSEPDLVPLIIHSAKVKDTGNWTCKSGDLTDVYEIVVGVKVNISVKFERVEEDETKNAKLICKADGEPQPTVQWNMDGVPINEEPEKYVMSRTKDNTYSLEIKRLTHADAGEYMCRLTQKALSHYVFKTFTLSVRHKPILFDYETRVPYPVEPSSKYTRTEEVFAVMNKTKEITCSALANPPPSFYWFSHKDGFDTLIPATPDTITLSEDGMSSTMQLRMLSQKDVGEYKCKASNKKGEVSVIFDVIPAAAPVQPDDIEFKDANATHITFKVLCANCTFKTEEVQSLDAKNLPIEGFTFQLVPHKEGFNADWDSGEKFDLAVGTGDGNDTTSLFMVGPMNNDTVFHVRVRSFNAAGQSDWIDMKELPKTTAHATRIIASFFILVIAMFLSYN